MNCAVFSPTVHDLRINLPKVCRAENSSLWFLGEKKKKCKRHTPAKPNGKATQALGFFSPYLMCLIYSCRRDVYKRNEWADQIDCKCLTSLRNFMCIANLNPE